MSTTPDYLPMLSRGGHRSPTEGACLMEYVSQLAGEGFSDQPRCTDPVLAAVARQVNDHTSDAARPRLAALAPDLAAVHRIDPRLVPALAAHCARVALHRDPGVRWLLRMASRAESRALRVRLEPATRNPRIALSNGLAGLRTLIPLAVRHLILATPGPIPHRDAEQDRVLYELLAGCLRKAGRAIAPTRDREPLTPC